MRWYCLWWTPI